MNSALDISDLKPRELSGILVCDALMLRDRIVVNNPKAIASVADSHIVILADTKGTK